MRFQVILTQFFLASLLYLQRPLLCQPLEALQEVQTNITNYNQTYNTNYNQRNITNHNQTNITNYNQTMPLFNGLKFIDEYNHVTSLTLSPAHLGRFYPKKDCVMQSKYIRYIHKPNTTWIYPTYANKCPCKHGDFTKLKDE